MNYITFGPLSFCASLDCGSWYRLRRFMKTEISCIIIVTLSIIALIGSMAHNRHTEIQSMERNIDSAIVKGIDPVAVRCAYKADSTMCAIYAAKGK